MSPLNYENFLAEIDCSTIPCYWSSEVTVLYRKFELTMQYGNQELGRLSHERKSWS
jgi:hypothetical protein